MANLLSALAVGLVASVPVSAQRGGWWNQNGNGNGAGSPEYTEKYQHPLWFPDVAQVSYTEEIDGKSIDYYELHSYRFQQQVYPAENFGPANLVGFNGSTPGPTFWIERGRESVVRLINDNDEATNIHLHGSPNHAVWDGWANDLVQPGQYKDYYYPNYESARPIWYHGHRDQHTANDAYMGQAGVYMIYDPEEDKLNLPKGNYDTMLVISDKRYQENGDLLSTTGEIIGFLGDIIQVNERPWPYMSTEPRKYRLRLFDMSLSRPYDLYFVDPYGNWLDFKVIASDAGLFRDTVDSNDITMAPGERYEIVIDFAGHENQEIMLKNKMEAPYLRDFAGTDEIMKFVVGDTVSDTTNNGDTPSELNPNVAFPEKRDTVDQVFNFQMGGDDTWTINGVSFDNVNNRVLANPKQGAVELWEVRHTGGPAVHPVHVHMVEFQVISREGGSRGLMPYEAAGLKDVVLLEPGEVIQLLAYYGPWHGVYMFHCHNLIHEDHAMMAAFNVSRLELLGYDNYTANLADPLGPDFAAKDLPAPAPWDTVEELAGLNAYEDPYGLKAAQRSWYSENGGYPAATPTSQEETAAPVSSGYGFAFSHNFAGPTPDANYQGAEHWHDDDQDWDNRKGGHQGNRQGWQGHGGWGGRGGHKRAAREASVITEVVPRQTAA